MSNENRGFTIIEVVASIAILSIISGVLLQMFVVSAKVDRKAFDIDRANLIASQIGESFKQSPISVADSVYYGFDWSKTDINNATNPPKFMVTVTTAVSPSVASTQETGYPDSVIGTVDLSANEYNLSVSSDGAVKVALNQVGTNLQYSDDIKSKITPDNAIPIVVNNAGDIPITINVDNKASPYEARVYVLSGGDNVKLSPIDGPSGIVNVGSGVQGFSDGTVTVTVTRLDDGLTLANYTVEKYFPEQ